MITMFLSNVNKCAVFKAYDLMKNYLHDDNIEDVECFNKMWREVEKLKILIPTDIYAKISEFMDSYLAPIVYERKKTYANCYTDDIGFYNDDGMWEIKSDEAFRLLVRNFMLKNLEIEEALDNFAVNVLQPYLVA